MTPMKIALAVLGGFVLQMFTVIIHAPLVERLRVEFWRLAAGLGQAG